jgi:selenocysteine lyase/cysteine desulfurase
MQTRRRFIGSIAYPTAACVAGAALDPARAARSLSALRSLPRRDGTPDQLARDEDFWFHVAQAFTQDRSVINLNNGGVSPAPFVVQEAMKRHLDYSNTAPPPYALWKILEPQKEGVRQRLAAEFGCLPEEVAITRNASESLQICQQGIDLKRGDEVLAITQDYPRMVTTFKQRQRREGIILRQFKLPVPAENPSEIVRLYQQNISANTRLMLVSHAIFLTGQILPVREIVAMARQRNVPVIVDGAHALAHIDFKISDLDCDYYAASLHKWLFAPHGTGFLYVRRDKIKPLWPLMAADEKQDDDIRKFEEIGTHPAANFLAIGEALTFHQGIGGARKEARLRYLRDHWTSRLLSGPHGRRIRMYTSLKQPPPVLSCGIATVEFEGLEPAKLQEWLWEKHKIFAVAIVHEEVNGLRISPSVYTTLPELDRFCAAVEAALKDGIG